MNLKLTFLFILGVFYSNGQSTQKEIEDQRKNHETELLDSNQHILSNEEIASFEGLDYYEFDSTFQVTATFTKNKGKKFEMPTSTNRLPIYRRYGYLTFKIDSIECRLTVYQNISLSRQKEYKDYLFIPFKDNTTRNETYGGGRYLDISIPEANSVILDFNLAYNPYCAYSHRYSCPIPPAENTLSVSISAGEKTPLAH